MRSAKNFFLILFLLFPISSYSQLSIQWQNIQCEGIACADRYWGLDIYNNFIMATGYSYEPAPYYSDAFLVKYDLNGNVIWKSKNRRISNQDYDFTKIDDQNNIYAVGMTNSPPTILMITKYSPQGDTIWNYFQLPNQSFTENYISDLIVTGNYIYFTSSVLKANLKYDLVLKKLDRVNADVVWEKFFPFNTDYPVYSVLHPDNSGSIYLSEIGKLYKFDSNGNVLWMIENCNNSTCSYGNLEFDKNDNSLVYLKYETYPDTTFKLFLEKIDLNANLIWSSLISENIFLSYNSFLANSSNIYMINGRNNLMKLNSNGQIIRESDILNIGYANYEMDKYENLYISQVTNYNNNIEIRSVQYDSSGKFINDNSIKLNWQMSYPSIKIDDNGFFYLYGRILNPEPDRGAVVIKFSTNVSITNISTVLPEKFKLYQNYPNPFNPETKIKFDINKDDHYSLEIFDVSGRLIEKSIDGFLKTGSYEVAFRNKNIASGIYLYRLKSGKYSETKKMILNK